MTELNLRSLIILSLGVMAASLEVDAQPVNDRFVDAIVIEGTEAEFMGTDVGATLEEGELNNRELMEFGGAGTVWWRWTSPELGWVDFDFGDRWIELTIGVFTGPNVENLTTAMHPMEFPMPFAARKGRQPPATSSPTTSRATAALNDSASPITSSTGTVPMADGCSKWELAEVTPRIWDLSGKT